VLVGTTFERLGEETDREAAMRLAKPRISQALGAAQVEINYGGVVARRAAYHRLVRPLLRIRDHDQERGRAIPMPLLPHLADHRDAWPRACRPIDDFESIPAEPCPPVGGENTSILRLGIPPLALGGIGTIQK
jgi:hypothetical protein